MRALVLVSMLLVGALTATHSNASNEYFTEKLKRSYLEHLYENPYNSELIQLSWAVHEDIHKILKGSEEVRVSSYDCWKNGNPKFAHCRLQIDRLFLNGERDPFSYTLQFLVYIFMSDHDVVKVEELKPVKVFE